MSQKLYVVRYSHRHGDEIYIHASPAGADNRLRELVEANLSEYDDCNAETLAEIKACLADCSRTDELCGLWADLTAESESLWVDDFELYA